MEALRWSSEVLSSLDVDEDVVGGKASQREIAPLEVDLDQGDEEGQDQSARSEQGPAIAAINFFLRRQTTAALSAPNAANTTSAAT